MNNLAFASKREIKIHNIAQRWINTYEDSGAKQAAYYYLRHVVDSPDKELIIQRMKEINGHV